MTEEFKLLISLLRIEVRQKRRILFDTPLIHFFNACRRKFQEM